MTKECPGCGAIIPAERPKCPICETDLHAVGKRAEAPSQDPAGPPRADPVRRTSQATGPATQVSAGPETRVGPERSFMSVMEELVLGGELPKMPARMVVNEILVLLFDRRELARKRYTDDGFSGVEVLQVRDLVGSPEFEHNAVTRTGKADDILVFGGTRVVFALKKSGQTHQQTQLVMKKVVDVADLKVPGNVEDSDMPVVKPMVEKLCDAMQSALSKLASGG